MNDDLLIALVGLVGAIVGAAGSQMFTAAKTHLEAYMLAQEMLADNQRLWQWNRSLIDHIYKGLGPPPPEPPDDLFQHEP
ncbi:hypothetical protein [Bifidobacterium callitrichidarum]|uniref:Uncharacterized protein n=1 Tax=Bifidobacterium callitrichidarum TaxID=2052941 RepID=A0A2U2N7D0_9BIFI|nr:hypothetical protein [Bifidobacterium callitrichidarum]PWG65040.1 hypothetical protein DF196_07810 [Bifidobacterium callitrichidarum]